MAKSGCGALEIFDDREDRLNDCSVMKLAPVLVFLILHFDVRNNSNVRGRISSISNQFHTFLAEKISRTTVDKEALIVSGTIGNIHVKDSSVQRGNTLYIEAMVPLGTIEEERLTRVGPPSLASSSVNDRNSSLIGRP